MRETLGVPLEGLKSEDTVLDETCFALSSVVRVFGVVRLIKPVLPHFLGVNEEVGGYSVWDESLGNAKVDLKPAQAHHLILHSFLAFLLEEEEVAWILNKILDFTIKHMIFVC